MRFALDAGLIAPFVERSDAMFASVLGTWLPFALIFAATWITGWPVGDHRELTWRAGHGPLRRS